MIRIEVNQARLVNLAIAAASEEIQVESKKEILAIGEIVASRSEGLALGGIPNIGRAWWDMRVGQNRNLVYVVPRKRGTKVPSRRRPQFAPLIMRKALIPARNETEDEVQVRFQALLARITESFNRG